MTKMDLERFAKLLDVYGGTSERWPEAERAAALAFTEASAEARRLAEDARALDRILDMSETAPATRDLEERILAKAPAARRGLPYFAFLASARWLPVGAVVCSLALGLAVGTQMPGIVGLDDEALAADTVSSVMASAADGEPLFGNEP